MNELTVLFGGWRLTTLQVINRSTQPANTALEKKKCPLNLYHEIMQHPKMVSGLSTCLYLKGLRKNNVIAKI